MHGRKNLSQKNGFVIGADGDDDDDYDDDGGGGGGGVFPQYYEALLSQRQPVLSTL